MRESSQEGNVQSGRAASEGQSRWNAHRDEKKVLLDIISYQRESDNCNALYDEFRKYGDEPNCMLPRIQGNIRQILKTRLQAGFDPGRGWLLAQRFSYNKFIPNRDRYCKVTKYDEIARDKQARKKDRGDEKIRRMEAKRDERKPVGFLERISSFFS